MPIYPHKIAKQILSFHVDRSLFQPLWAKVYPITSPLYPHKVPKKSLQNSLRNFYIFQLMISNKLRILWGYTWICRVRITGISYRKFIHRPFSISYPYVENTDVLKRRIRDRHVLRGGTQQPEIWRLCRNSWENHGKIM